MNLDNKAIKGYIKSLPPYIALERFELYKIPSPYKEILTLICVERQNEFSALEELRKRYKIYMEYWTFVRRLKDALEMFDASHKAYTLDTEKRIG